jgi:hypothetical protein
MEPEDTLLCSKEYFSLIPCMLHISPISLASILSFQYLMKDEPIPTNYENPLYSVFFIFVLLPPTLVQTFSKATPDTYFGGLGFKSRPGDELY